MSGIFGLYSREKSHHEERCVEYFYSYRAENIINEQFNFENFSYGRSVINKFIDDRILFENSDLIIAFEGVCYNKRRGELIDFILKEFKKTKMEFLLQLKGLFSGFIFSKDSSDLYVFNDPLSTKPIYYFQNHSIFLFSSELKVVSKFLTKNKFPVEQEIDAWRCILTFGYLLENLTPIKNVKKLRYGSYLHVNLVSNSKHIHHYYEFPTPNSIEFSNHNLLKSISQVISTAVQNEWSKDLEYNYDHFSFLSGGLDSRFNLLLANQLGYENINSLTFSESGTLDEKIADKISSDYGFNHTFLALDDGTYLEENLEKYVQASDGVVVLHGAAHLQYSISKMNFNSFGLGHSGQIGDVIFGSYYREGSISENLNKACYNFDLDIINKITLMNQLRGNNFHGDTPELFLYKNRAINGILNGDRVANNYFDTSSPFYDIDLIELGLNIPKRFKQNARLYRNLISKMYPFMTQYKWQQTGIRPKVGVKNEVYSFLIRLKRFSQRKFGLKTDNMNPFNIWYSNNHLFELNVINTFNSNIHYIDDIELKNDIIKTFSSDDTSNKLAALTVLLSIKMHFNS